MCPLSHVNISKQGTRMPVTNKHNDSSSRHVRHKQSCGSHRCRSDGFKLWRINHLHKQRKDCEEKTSSASGHRTSRRMLYIPSPSEINPWLVRTSLFRNAMLKMLLQHALHCHEVAISEHHRSNRPLTLFGPICTNFKLPLLAKRERDDSDILELSLK